MKNNQRYPTDLTDRQWDCIKELIPAAKPGGHPRTLEMQAVVNAILSLLVTGCQWRMLPRELSSLAKCVCLLSELAQ